MIEKEDITSLLNVRTYNQYCEAVEYITQNKCLFCQLDLKLNKIIKEVPEGWRLWQTPHPIKHTAHHLVITPTKHITDVAAMTQEDWRGLTSLIEYATGPDSKLNLPGGAVVMRFGPPKFNAGSIRHLHVNILVPDGTGEVRVPFAKTPEDIEHKKKILAVFEKMRTGTPFEELDPEEQDLVRDRLTG